ncbi:hypothetical protein JHW43_005411 [Diplocarpon mali]|nr:hypothetical protein JHW43_005411 [Diplocarpon mali]
MSPPYGPVLDSTRLDSTRLLFTPLLSTPLHSTPLRSTPLPPPPHPSASAHLSPRFAAAAAAALLQIGPAGRSTADIRSADLPTPYKLQTARDRRSKRPPKEKKPTEQKWE